VVVSAGTSDQPVAAEAAAVAGAVGLGVRELRDVGVAGVHRLLAEVELLAGADAVICIAGMEGALPSVVGGLVGCPVIAVPTSVGYGASFEGVTPLLAMLSSCAPGLVVVNIDSGFGAAMAAHRMAAGR
jgi:NCAIR mutase (PurE)-related protein